MEDSNGTSAPSIARDIYGTLKDGSQVDIYTLTNGNGVVAKILNYGGIVTELHVPDRNGKMGDVVLGFDNLEDYVEKTPYFGCLIGRVGNRTANGKFTIDGVEYSVPTNEEPGGKPCGLHGGLVGFDKRLWSVEAVESGEDGPSLIMTLESKDMDQGFPGTLNVTATYTLTNRDGLKLTYSATTDKTTVINLTQHSYFNLNEGTDTILDHEVMIAADHYTPVDAGLIPTGEIAPVKDTPLDFNSPTRIGDRINDEDEQLRLGGGYDHNWVMRTQDGSVILQATATDSKTGRKLEVLSDEPGVQFYSGNFLDGTLTGKKGVVYEHRYGLCFEPQHYPDSANHPSFPTILLKPGETFKSTIIYRFLAE
jgi:aldose 1-epimerase